MWRLSQGWFPSLNSTEGTAEVASKDTALLPESTSKPEVCEESDASATEKSKIGHVPKREIEGDLGGLERKSEQLQTRTTFELVVSHVTHSLYMKRLHDLITRYGNEEFWAKF